MTNHAPTIADALDKVRHAIAEAEARFQRNPHSVHLLAVSKTKPLAAIRQAIEAGQYAFGENYVQEGVEKIQALGERRCQWHFIGPLQSNKSRLVAEHFDWIHTVDRVKIAERLQAQRPEHCAPLNVCLQINVSGEQSKSGLNTELPALLRLAERITELPRLRLRGLMCIPEPSAEFEQQRRQFAKVQQRFAQLQAHYPEQTIDTLSMGMSNDLDAAIAEGSTLVRVGSAIFGQRPPKPTPN